MSYLKKILDNKIVVLDGGTGTELSRVHGIKLGDPLFSAGAVSAHPEALIAVHASYLKAGAQVVDVASFRTNERAYTLAGLTPEESARDTRKAVELGLRAIAQSRFDAVVAGGITSRGDCYNPQDRFAKEIMGPEHARHIQSLIRGGVQIIFVETIPTAYEGEFIARHISRRTNTPFMVSYTVGEDGNLLDGTPIAKTAAYLSKLSGFTGVGINCCPVESAEAGVENLVKAGYKGRLALYPNGISAEEGPSGEELGWIFARQREKNSATFISSVLRMTEKAVNAGMQSVWVGGCCGTTPVEIAAISHAVKLAGHDEKRNFVAGFRPAAAASTVPWLTGACCGRPHGWSQLHADLVMAAA